MLSSSTGRSSHIARKPHMLPASSRLAAIARQEARVAWSVSRSCPPSDRADGRLIEIELAGALGGMFDPPQTDGPDDRVERRQAERGTESWQRVGQRGAVERAGAQRVDRVAGRDGV